MAGLMFLVIADHMIMLPLMPEICRNFGVRDYWVPALIGSYSVATFVSAFAWGPWSDRLGRASLLRIFAAGFTLANLLCALSTNVWMLLAGRVITGLFGGPLGVTLNAYVGDLYEGDRRTRAIAYLSMGFPVAVILAVPVGAVVGGAWGWQSVPFSLAAIGVILTALVLHFPHIQLPRIPQTLLTEYGEMFYVVFNRRGWPFFLSIFLIMATFFGYVANIAVWLVRNQGMDVTLNHHLALMYLYGGVGSILGAISFRKMVNVFGRVELLVGSALLSGGMVYLLVSRPPNTVLWVLCLLFFLSQFSGSLRRPLAGLIAVDIAPAHLRGRYMAMLNITISLAFGVAAGWSELVLTYPDVHRGQVYLIGMDKVALYILAGTLASIPALHLVNAEIRRVQAERDMAAPAVAEPPADDGLEEVPGAWDQPAKPVAPEKPGL